MTDFSFTTETTDDSGGTERLDTDYSLHDNVAIDLTEYSRSRIVRNEEQFLLTTLGYVSGFMEDSSHYISGVLIGTAGSGKTHLQHQVEKLFPDEYMYHTTSGSETSIIYDDSWEDAYIASLDELQKPSDELIEILKSLHGDDEEFKYKVTGGGRGADRDVDEIIRTAMPYWFLYAQYEPDFEMWDRLLKVPVHESREKNEGVLATKWDHSMVAFSEGDDEYIFDLEDGRRAIKNHIIDIPDNQWVKIPAGEDVFGWNALKHAKNIFDIDRSETNRVGAMVANLVRASALLNHNNRERHKVNVPNEGVKEAIIAEPQDLANVLGTRETLLATTHQLDRKKKAICLAIEETGGSENISSIDDIQNFLRKTNASFVKRSEIEHMLEDLIDNYLVEKHERAGDKGRHLYEFKGWQKLGKFEINDEFKEVFEGTTDPIRGQPFIETAKEINADLEPTASDFIKEEDVEVAAEKKEQATLAQTAASEFEDVTLEPYEELVRARLYDTLDGERIDDLDEHEPTIKEMLGVVPIGEDSTKANIDGTVFDPDHEVWEYGPDDWVTTPNEADQQIEQAIRHLTEEGVFKTSTIRKKGGTPLSMKVSVASEEEVKGEQ